MIENTSMVNVFKRLAKVGDVFKIDRQEDRMVIFALYEYSSENIATIIRKIMQEVSKEGRKEQYEIDDIDSYSVYSRLAKDNHHGFVSFYDDQYYYSVEAYSSKSRMANGVVVMFTVEAL